MIEDYVIRVSKARAEFVEKQIRSFIGEDVYNAVVADPSQFEIYGLDLKEFGEFVEKMGQLFDAQIWNMLKNPQKIDTF